MRSLGRGHWDRSLGGERRRAAQRERLLAAVINESTRRGRALAVRHVIEAAGVGRNTFYEHFFDLDAALAVAREEVRLAACSAWEKAELTARTPIERLRALAAEWLSQASTKSSPTVALLRDGSASGESLRRELGARLKEALTSARASGVVGLAIEPVRLSCIIGAFEESAHFVADQPDADLKRAIDVLVDVTLRAFR